MLVPKVAAAFSASKPPGYGGSFEFGDLVGCYTGTPLDADAWERKRRCRIFSWH